MKGEFRTSIMTPWLWISCAWLFIESCQGGEVRMKQGGEMGKWPERLGNGAEMRWADGEAWGVGNGEEGGSSPPLAPRITLAGEGSL